LPPIRPDSASDVVYPSIAHDAGAPWSSDPRSTVPGPAPAPRPASSIDASPSTEPMAAVSAPNGATSTIPGVGVGVGGVGGDARRRRPGSETDAFRAARPAWLSTRNLAIGGGAIVVLIVSIVLATRGGDDKTSAKNTTTAKLESKKASNSEGAATGGTDVATTEGGNAQSGEQSGESPTGTGVRTNNNSQGAEGIAATGSDATATDATDATDTTDTTETTTTAEAGSAATPPAPKPRTTRRTGASRGSTLGGKQVVLEYDSQARDTKTAAPSSVGKSDQSAITKARSAYASGNQRLFAGDPEGAIRFYRQALAYYPAYVAGYRGLGLAYAQQGNKAAAIQAFKTYVSSVPTAKDASLIRKRITSLQH
jgi:hypothetical protein